jgi:hypothetical protein
MQPAQLLIDGYLPENITIHFATSKIGREFVFEVGIPDEPAHKILWREIHEMLQISIPPPHKFYNPP